MVQLTTFALLALTAAGSLANPFAKRASKWDHKNSQCMSRAEAQQVADNYSQLIRNFTVAGADVALSPDFTDYSEGVNTLINTCPQGSAAKTLPLLSPTFQSQQEFEVGQGQQPKINFRQLGIWHTCDTVIIRWETTNTAPRATNPVPVIGIIILEAEKAPSGNMYPWIIREVFSEFDSGAWLQNLERAGICSETQSGSPPVTYSGAPASATPPATSAAVTSAAATSAAATSAAPSASGQWS